MKLSKNFTLAEFTHSQMAIERGILNEPDAEQREAIQQLVDHLSDCYCASGPEHLLQVLLDSGLPFDQAIVYRRKRFLHLSYRQGRCRKMVLYT